MFWLNGSAVLALSLVSLFRSFAVLALAMSRQSSCIFVVNPVKSSDRDAICPLAERIPKVKRVNIPTEDNRRIRCHDSIVRVFDYLLKNPDDAPDVWGSIQSKLAVTKKSPEKSLQDGSQPGPSNGGACIKSTFNSISPNFKAQVLASIPNSPFTNDILSHLHEADPGVIDDIWLLFSQIHKDDRVPEDCRNNMDVLLATCVARIIQVDLPYQEWFEKSVDTDDWKINWAALPLIECAWTAGKLTKVGHMCGHKAELKSHVAITMDFALENMFSDRDARFFLSPSSIPLSDIFAAGEGVNRCRLDKKGKMMGTLCVQAQAELKQRRESLLALQAPVVEVVLEDQQKKRRAEAARIAREAAAKRPKTTMRALTFDSAA